MKVTMPHAFACLVSITQAFRDAGFQEAGFGWVSENGSLRIAILYERLCLLLHSFHNRLASACPL
jgi:hypothetical protein